MASVIEKRISLEKALEGYNLKLNFLYDSEDVNVDELANTILERANIIIDLLDVYNDIYEVEKGKINSRRVLSFADEQEKVIDLTDLATKHKQEIDDLFLSYPDITKGIYTSEHIDEIKACLEKKREVERLERENALVLENTTILENIKNKYDVVVEGEVKKLKDTALKAYNLLSIDENEVNYVENFNVRMLNLATSNLAYSKVCDLDLSKENKKLLKQYSTLKMTVDEYDNRLKQIVIYIKNNIDTFHELTFDCFYRNLLVVRDYLNELEEYREEMEMTDKDKIEFLTDAVDSTLDIAKEQLPNRTRLEFYKTLLASNEMRISEIYEAIVTNKVINELLGQDADEITQELDQKLDDKENVPEVQETEDIEPVVETPVTIEPVVDNNVKEENIEEVVKDNEEVDTSAFFEPADSNLEVSPAVINNTDEAVVDNDNYIDADVKSELDKIVNNTTKVEEGFKIVSEEIASPDLVYKINAVKSGNPNKILKQLQKVYEMCTGGAM